MHSDLEVWRLKLFWSFEKSGPNRYRLIGIDNYGTALMRAEYAPGYESRQLRDIIKATWYLNAGSRSIYTDYLSRKGKKGFKPAFTVVAVCKCKSCSFVALCVIYG